MLELQCVIEKYIDVEIRVLVVKVVAFCLSAFDIPLPAGNRL